MAKRAFKVEQKAFFIIFKGHLIEKMSNTPFSVQIQHTLYGSALFFTAFHIFFASF